MTFSNPFVNPAIIPLICFTLVVSCASSQHTEDDNIISASQLISAITKGEPVVYRDVTIEGDLDFTTLQTAPLTPNNFVSTVSAPLYFERCTFKGRVVGFVHRGDTAVSTRFLGSVSFNNCRFQADVDFRGATFQHHLYLNQSLFDKQVQLQAVRVGGDLRLEKAVFSSDLYAQEAVIQGAFWGKEANILGQFSAQQADFWQNTVFSAIAIQGYADFGLAQFRRSAFFEYGKFHGRLNYSGAIFRHRAEWTKARFEQAADFQNAWFSFKPVFDEVYYQAGIDLSNVRFDGGEPEKNPQ